jgi:putative ABC transport system substrate-binding protein
MIKRREFIAGIGTAAAWPVVAWAQQGDRVRRIGLFLTYPQNEAETSARVTAFVQELRRLGWIEGHNVRFDYYWSGSGLDADRYRAHAAELVALAPDVILAIGEQGVRASQQATRTIPIVFAGVVDPVGDGLVASLARPGGNTTGFSAYEYSLSVKWLELLKEIAPNVKRVMVFRQSSISGSGMFGAIQGVASSFGVEVRPSDARDAGEIERAVTSIAREPNGGLIVAGSAAARDNRDVIIALTARHRLPAVYPFRVFVADGGLISYGVDQVDPLRRAASYVDRILKGEKPAHLPVQVPTKYEMALNLKTAKVLGLKVPQSILLRADEVIQ